MKGTPLKCRNKQAKNWPVRKHKLVYEILYLFKGYPYTFDKNQQTKFITK